METKFARTSSPSPMQLASKVHTDQFQGKPARERRADSMASSRLERRERNNAFLEGIDIHGQRGEYRTYRKRSQGSDVSITCSKSSLRAVFTGIGGW